MSLNLAAAPGNRLKSASAWFNPVWSAWPSLSVDNLRWLGCNSKSIKEAVIEGKSITVASWSVFGVGGGFSVPGQNHITPHPTPNWGHPGRNQQHYWGCNVSITIYGLIIFPLFIRCFYWHCCPVLVFRYYISPQNKIIVSLHAIVYFWIIHKTSDTILSCVYTDVELKWHLQPFVSRPNISPNKILFETTAGWRVMRGGSPPPHTSSQSSQQRTLPFHTLFPNLLDLSGWISVFTCFPVFICRPGVPRNRLLCVNITAFFSLKRA